MTYSSQEISGSLGRYQLLKKLGSGDVGEVWLGSDPHLQRQVAIKALSPRVQGAQDVQARFEREVEAVAALNHPHILPIHDFGTQALPDGQFITYFVMPYIAGGSLADLLAQRVREQQRLTPDEVLIFLSQIADALDYAHTQGVLHQNIKLTNLLLRSEQWLLVADFGIAETDGGKPGPYGVGETEVFLAPEQVEGHPVPASDIYSLAVVASLLLTNQLTLRSKTSVRLPADLPSACKEVLLRGMAKKPDERYPSAHAFVDALQHSFSTVLLDGKGKRMTRRLLLLGGGVTLAGVGLWALSTRLPTTQQPIRPASDPDAPLLILQEHHKPAQTLTWAPNKRILVSASSEDAQIKLWDLAQLKPQQPATFKSSLSRTWSGSNLVLAWSPDGTSLALASKEKTDSDGTSHIVLLNPTLDVGDTGAERSFSVPAPAAEGLIWLKQSFLVAAWNDPAQSGKPGYLGMWDTRQPDLIAQPVKMSEVFTTRSALDPRRTLAVTPDGTRLAVCTTNGVLIGSPEITDNTVVWQPVSPGLLQYQPGRDPNEVKTLIWWDSKNLLALLKNGASNAPIGWSLKPNGPEFLQLGVPSPSIRFNAIAMRPSADEFVLAGGSEEGEVYLWHNGEGSLPFRTLKSGGIRGKVLALSWSFDGQWLAASYDDRKASMLIWKL
jgi:serine/threonine protein kinase